MTIDLVYDSDCPNVAKARTNLLRAVTEARCEARWSEWAGGDTRSPAHVKGFGSPTILVNGRDVLGTEPSAHRGSSCRIYRDEGGGVIGAPAATVIAAALRMPIEQIPRAADKKTIWRNSLAGVPGIAVAFLPNLVCPACWPAYAGVLSALKLGFLANSSYLFATTCALLAVSLGSLAYKASHRRGLIPFWLGIASTALVLGGKFAADSALLTYSGIAGLIGASLWNAWPKAERNGCTACVPAMARQGSGAELITMNAIRKIEVFSAGCPACEETIALVNQVACPSCEVIVLDMRHAGVAERARGLGVRSVPAVVIDGKLADCCADRGPSLSTLSSA